MIRASTPSTTPPRAATALLALAVLALGAGCSGLIGDPGTSGNTGGAGGPGGGSAGAGGSPPSSSASLTCKQGSDPGVAPLRRLSLTQYRNALTDLFGASLLAAPAIATQLARLPADGLKHEIAAFGNMDTRVSQQHIEAFYGVTDALTRAATADSAKLTALAGVCAAQTPLQKSCVEAFIARFGRRALRHQLGAAEVARFAELHASNKPASEVFRGVLFTMLLSPRFLYHVEIDGQAIDGRDHYVALDAYGIAARLAFHFWQSIPDDALLDAAASGELLSADGYKKQVDRLFADPRTKTTAKRFWSDWLRLATFGGFASTPAFKAFAGSVNATRALYDDAVREVEDLIAHTTFSTDGNVHDLLTSKLSFARTPALAALYGVPVWDGSSTPPTLPPGERSGLLTRAAMLISSNESTNPFRRGIMIRREILCAKLSPPDPAALPPDALKPPEPDPSKTTRQRFADKTQSPLCAGCHGRFNALGFALEAYDGLGRYRSSEVLFDDTGRQLGSLPVDTAASVAIDESGGRHSVAGPVDLMARIADSGVADTCFARHYFRYTYRRDETKSDNCAVKAVRDALQQGGIRAALRAVAVDPAFKRRLVQ